MNRLQKRYNNILSNNLRKLKRIVVVFAMQHQQRKEKLTVPTTKATVNVATLPCKMKRSPSRYTRTPKRDKIPPTKTSLLMNIVELSTAVVKVDIKVNNDSSTQNQCLQSVTPHFNAC